MKKYKHRKSGNIYKFLHLALDCTNSNDAPRSERMMIVYQGEDGSVYVRNQKEFDKNFELLT
jgi:hypothetical protein